MRISDWSSDVCSSDLLGLVLVEPVAAQQRAVGVMRGLLGRRFAAAQLVDHEGRVVVATGQQPRRHSTAEILQVLLGQLVLLAAADQQDAAVRQLGRDRKRVGKGKSGSVRVDLGGRRNIKKKKNKHT